MEEHNLYAGQKSCVQVGETYIQGRNTISGEGNPIVKGENLYMEGHILYPSEKSYIQGRNPILGERKSYIQRRNTIYRWRKSIYAGAFPISRGEILYSGKKSYIQVAETYILVEKSCRIRYIHRKIYVGKYR